MSMRKIKDALDIDTNERIYFKGHAKATYMSDGRTVEDAIKTAGGGGGMAVIDHGTEDTIFTLTDKGIHKWDEVSSLVLSLPDDPPGTLPTYQVIATMGSGFSLSLPSDCIWNQGVSPVFAERGVIELSIRNKKVGFLLFPPAGASVGDVVYVSPDNDIKTIPYSLWESSKGTPIGIVVIPKDFAPDKKARCISLQYAGAIAGTNNTATDNATALAWGTQGTDTSLANCQTLYITDNRSLALTSTNASGYLPSDKFTGEVSLVDPLTKYSGTTPFAPSPYSGTLPNTEYYKAISGKNNTLADFGGDSNTETLKGLGTAWAASYSAFYYKDVMSRLSWYLPAAGEIGYLMARWNVISAALAAVGGAALPTSGNLWTSSEYGGSYANHVNVANGFIGNLGKATGAFVRPFALLSL